MPKLPVPGLLLLAAALVPGAPISPHAVEWIATVALVVILLDGGIDIGWQRMRASIRPVVSLGVLGTFMTAAGIALAAHTLLGFEWKLAGVIGAALAPTDPAVVFSVLGGTEIRGRAGTVIEGEAGVNDPAGIALMLGMIDLATHNDATLLNVAAEFGLQMGIGLAFGVVAARVLRPLARHEIALLAAAGALYAVTAIAHGSGFLAVFVAGLALGDNDAPREINRRLASLSEVVVFVALGLTIRTAHLPVGDALILTAILIALIRPLTVIVALATARLDRGDRVFISWAGLKGAVPILLAAFAVIHHVDRAQDIYGLVFVAVLASVLLQGSLVPAVARRVLRP